MSQSQAEGSVSSAEVKNGSPQASTDVARVPVSLGMRLNGLDEAYRLSKNLALANSLPTALRGKPSDVLAIVLYGQELGLAPMQSIQGIYVVEGRPMLAAQTWIALARRDGHKVRVLDRTPLRSVTVEITRRDDPEFPYSYRATIEQAIQAGKCRIVDGKLQARSKEGKVLPWEAYTDNLLLARAVSNACRFACPEIALGFYSEGDFDEDASRPSLTDIHPPIVAETPEADGDGIEDAEIIADPEPDPEAVRADLDALQAEFAVVEE